MLEAHRVEFTSSMQSPLSKLTYGACLWSWFRGNVCWCFVTRYGVIHFAIPMGYLHDHENTMV